MRYEIGIHIETYNIVWLHGPFPCGKYLDLHIFDLALSECLNESECVVADEGYTTVKCLQPSTVTAVFKNAHGRIRALHEILNRRMKQFRVLGTTFSLNPTVHSICFYAIPNRTQLMLQISDPLFDI